MPGFAGPNSVPQSSTKLTYPSELSPYMNLGSQFNSYGLSYEGGDKDRLMGKQAYQNAAFPGWLPGAQVGALQNVQRNLPNLFNTDALQGSFNQMEESNRSQATSAAGAAARAAANRAMLSGGRVGASFAMNSALQPMFAQQAKDTLGFNQLLSDISNQRAQLSAQLAQGISGLREQAAGRKTNYAVEAARLAQKRIGFQGSSGQGSGGYGGGSGADSTPQAFGRFGMGAGQMTPGYIGNSGPVQDMTMNGQAIPNRAAVGWMI